MKYSSFPFMSFLFAVLSDVRLAQSRTALHAYRMLQPSVNLSFPVMQEENQR